MEVLGITMYIVFLSLIVIFFGIIAVIEARELKRQRGKPITEQEKCKGYLQGISMLWGAVLAVFLMCFIGGISLNEIGFRKFSFNYGFWFTAITLTVSGIFFAFQSYQLIALVANTKSAQKKQIASDVIRVMPRTKKEKWLFSFLALSAGVCEEIIFRGFMLYLLMAIFPGMPIYLVILIPIAIFGLGHLYQGLQGVIGTALLGAIFICLYLVTGNLLLPIILHFLNDLIGTFFFPPEDKSYE